MLREGKSFLRRHLSPDLYIALQAPLRLPALYPFYWARQLKILKGLDHQVLPVTNSVHVIPPNTRDALSVFQSHALTWPDRREALDFLQLAAGCTSLIDVGASIGFFSALFAQSRAGKAARIVSVEPEPLSFAMLQETVEANEREHVQWDCRREGIADQSKEMNFQAAPTIFQNAVVTDKESDTFSVACFTLADFCHNENIVPDLIKIDVEGFEYEILMSSKEFLETYRPRIHLELHRPFIERKGEDPDTLLSMLESVGYRQLKKQDKPLSLRHLRTPTSGLYRLQLVPF